MKNRFSAKNSYDFFFRKMVHFVFEKYFSLFLKGFDIFLNQRLSLIVTMARILESGITLVHPYSRNKSHKQDCLFFLLAFKGCRMGRSDKVSLWYVSLLINTRFRF